MVEGFVLPFGAASSGEFINAVRGALDSSQNFGQDEGPPVTVAKSGEQQMCVVWHDDSGMKLDRSAMVMEAMLQGECASLRREFQGFLSAKGHEQWAIVSLIVGQAATVFVAAEGRGGHGW